MSRAEKSGFAAEAYAKIHSKYNDQLASQILQWISDVSGQEMNTSGDVENFLATLKDGTVLCAFANSLSPGAIPKVNSSKLAFKQMENIQFFLNFLETKCEVSKNELFQTVDLYDGQDPNSVTVALASLARKTDRLFGRPGFGPREVEKSAPREWSEDKLRAGETIIGLQMGSNKGASQSGMTPSGMTRHM